MPPCRSTASPRGRPSLAPPAAPGGTVATYVYRATDIPKPVDEPVRLNLWLFNGAATQHGQPVEIVVETFTFAP